MTICPALPPTAGDSRLPLWLTPEPSLDPALTREDLHQRASAYLAEVERGMDQSALVRELGQIGATEMRASADLLAEVQAHQATHSRIDERLRREATHLDALLAARTKGRLSRIRRALTTLRAALRSQTPTPDAALDRMRELHARAELYVEARCVSEHALDAGIARINQLTTLLEAVDDGLRRLSHHGIDTASLQATALERQRDLTTHAAVLTQARASLAILAANQDRITRAITAQLATTNAALQASHLAHAATSPKTH